MKKGILLFIAFSLISSLQNLTAQCTNGGFTLQNQNLNYPYGTVSTSGSYTASACSDEGVDISVSFSGSNNPLLESYVDPYDDNALVVNHNHSGTPTSTLVFTFSEPVILKNMVIGDVDRSSHYIDIIDFTADAPVNIINNSPSTVTVTGQRVVATGGNANTNATISIYTTEPITTLRIDYSDSLSTSGNRFITVENGAEFCCDTCTLGSTTPSLDTTQGSINTNNTTFNLGNVNATNTPSGSVLNWYTDEDLTNKITNLNVSNGTYYAAFYNSTEDCTSNPVTFYVIKEIIANDDCIVLRRGETSITTPLTNDTLGTEQATSSNVYYDPFANPSGITVNPDLTITANSTSSSGGYGFGYRITETPQPASGQNRDTGFTRVLILFDFTAVNDTYTSNGSSSTVNVLANDEVQTSGSTVITGLSTSTGKKVTISPVGSLPTGFSLSSTGILTIPANLPQESTYTIQYKICDVASNYSSPCSTTEIENNCSTATVTVTVPLDTDYDGIPNSTDIDDDNDGIFRHSRRKWR